jgi:hypothetical protein
MENGDTSDTNLDTLIKKPLLFGTWRESLVFVNNWSGFVCT